MASCQLDTVWTGDVCFPVDGRNVIDRTVQ